MKQRKIIQFKNAYKQLGNWQLLKANLVVNKNEIVGLYGPNGSGKTTILKLMAQILKPDSGSIKVVGKVVPIIELGAGLHPDLTGKENIYLYGSILGVSKKSIDAVLNQIVKLSELQSVINTQVKKYSTGMKTRLAFAIAINTPGNIFLFDEVMSVGDQDFKIKSINMIKKLKRKATVVIASHNLPVLLNICDRIITIDQGQIISGGNSEDQNLKKFIRRLLKEKSLFVNCLSNSMAPTLKKGQKITIAGGKFEQVKTGQIIVFCFKPLSHFIIHRVVSKTKVGGKTKLLTKGDAGIHIDSWLIGKENFVGTVIT